MNAAAAADDDDDDACVSGDATEIKLRDLKPASNYFVKYVNLIHEL